MFNRKVATWLLLLAMLGLGQSRPPVVHPTAHGVIKSISGSQLYVQVDEEHEMKFRMTRKTKILLQGKTVKPSSLEPGQTVDIDMQSSLDGSFEALNITVASPKP